LDGSEESIANLKEKRVLVFCGIARPERFRSLLVNAGIDPIHFLAFPDHFPYPSKAVEEIIKVADTRGADVCLTTEKDAVKIKDNRAFQDIPTYFLRICIQTEKKLFEKVFSVIQRRGVPDV
jgi:tetraacyldisaccharide 4'-kinase